MSKVIPRFLYHLTSKANYELIINSGLLKASEEDCITGIFSTELSNLFKRWRGSKDWKVHSLQERLLKYCADGDNALVMLKIPTSNINTDRLIIRSQNRAFRESSQLAEIYKQKKIECNNARKQYVQDKMDRLDKDISQYELGRFKDKFLEEACENFPVPTADDIIGAMSLHILKGAPAKERKLFQQRKEAIEYIYPENITTSQFEKIGEVNVDELRKTAEYDPLKPMRSIFSALLKGTPQEKGALLLNC